MTETYRVGRQHIGENRTVHMSSFVTVCRFVLPVAAGLHTQTYIHTLAYICLSKMAAFPYRHVDKLWETKYLTPLCQEVSSEFINYF